MKTTCIVCPIGCLIEINKVGDDVVVSGNLCARGAAYGKQEFTAPTRMVTDVIMTKFGVISCKTSQPIAKDKITEVLAIIGASMIDREVVSGEVLISNILDMQVDIIATKGNKNRY